MSTSTTVSTSDDEGLSTSSATSTHCVVARERPGMFYGSQGSFNYMLFSAADEGTIRLEQRELQVQTGRTDRADVLQRFAFDGSEPMVVGDPVVLHWVRIGEASRTSRAS